VEKWGWVGKNEIQEERRKRKKGNPKRGGMGFRGVEERGYRGG